MIKTFIEPFFTESDSQELKEITKKIQKPLQDRLLAFAECSLAVSKYNELKESPLEIEETDQERKKRLDKLYKDAKTLKTRLLAIEKVIFVLKAQAESIETRAFSRYTEQKEDADILKDCLEIIQAFEPDDIKQFDKSFDKDTLSPVIKFSNALGRVVVATYCNYFVEIKDNKSGFKILKAVYDRTLDFYPQGFSDDDKKNPDCLFDKAFFKALKELKDKQDRLNYEFGVLSPYDHSNYKIIPSHTSFTKYHTTLGILAAQDKQMTIDDLIESQRTNNLVTFENQGNVVFNEKVAEKDDLVFQYENLDDVVGGGVVISKAFIMCLEKMNHLGYFKRDNVNHPFTISVNDLKDEMGYCDYKSAQTALKQIKKTLENLKVKLSNKEKGKSISVPWFAIGWENPGALLFVPDLRIKWVYFQSFAGYPPYIYKLNTHAYKLAYYIFTLARINKTPKKNGDIVFSLSLVSVAKTLGLPDVDTIKKDYKKLIFDKIVKAVDEILKKDQAFYKANSNLKIVFKYQNNLTAKDIIKSGSLEITLKKNQTTETYGLIRDTQHEKIEKKARRAAMNKRKAKENAVESDE